MNKSLNACITLLCCAFVRNVHPVDLVQTISQWKTDNTRKKATFEWNWKCKICNSQNRMHPTKFLKKSFVCRILGYFVALKTENAIFNLSAIFHCCRLPRYVSIILQPVKNNSSENAWKIYKSLLLIWKVWRQWFCDK